MNNLLNDINEHIRIEIKNSQKRFVILLNKYIDSEDAELTITNIKDNNRILNDQSVKISSYDYNYYISNICKIILNWDTDYSGEKDIEFSIKVNIDQIIKNIKGKGKIPNNWNIFIKQLAEIETKYNKIIKEKETKITLFNLNILNQTIDDLVNNIDFCTLYVPEKNDKFSISESIPSQQLNSFIEYLEINDLFDKEYLSKYEYIINKNINDLTYKELLTYLTIIIKRESIYPSSLYNDVSNGLLLKVLKRIKDVIS